MARIKQICEPTQQRIVLVVAAVLTDERLSAVVTQYVAVQPVALTKLHVAPRTLVQTVTVHSVHVLVHARRTDRLPALRADRLLRRVRAFLVTEKRGVMHKLAATLGTHVWLLTRVGPHVVPEKVRRCKVLCADRAIVGLIDTDAVRPQMTFPRKVPPEFLVADGALVPGIDGMDPHVRGQRCLREVSFSTLSADKVLVRGMGFDVNS